MRTAFALLFLFIALPASAGEEKGVGLFSSRHNILLIQLTKNITDAQNPSYDIKHCGGAVAMLSACEGAVLPYRRIDFSNSWRERTDQVRSVEYQAPLAVAQLYEGQARTKKNEVETRGQTALNVLEQELAALRASISDPQTPADHRPRLEQALQRKERELVQLQTRYSTELTEATQAHTEAAKALQRRESALQKFNNDLKEVNEKMADGLNGVRPVYLDIDTELVPKLLFAFIHQSFTRTDGENGTNPASPDSMSIWHKIVEPLQRTALVWVRKVSPQNCLLSPMGVQNNGQLEQLRPLLTISGQGWERTQSGRTIKGYSSHELYLVEPQLSGETHLKITATATNVRDGSSQPCYDREYAGVFFRVIR